MLVFVTACGSDQQVVSGGNDDPTPPASDPDVGAAELVLSVEVGGGLLPAGQAFRTVPSAVVYGDGTTLSPGATVAIYPGPAAVPITRGTLDKSELERLVSAAGNAGLLDDTDDDYGRPPVADVTTTTVRIVAGGKTHVTSVYALHPGATPLPGVGFAQQQARERVVDYVDLVIQAIVAAEGEPYVPERYWVLPLAPDLTVDPAVAPDGQNWPFPDVVLGEGECTVVSGNRAIELGHALQTATEISRWRTASGETFVLSVRPALPHEADCPG
ncbi:hypothetical protein BH24ACT1_BH24ACT1_05860 [soil metagenome]